MWDSTYNRYIERLLNDQYEAAELLGHELTKGEIREEFIREQINNQFGGTVLCVSGVLSIEKKKERYKQCDLALLSHKTRRRELGHQYLINPKDVLLIADVKSSLKMRDIKEWDEIAKKIHKRAKKEKWVITPQIGLISYRYTQKISTLLKKFGYKYVEQIDTWVYEKGSVFYKNIDYVFVLENSDTEDKRILLRRDEVKKKGHPPKSFKKYLCFLGNGAVDNFWAILESLGKIAN